MNKLPTSQSTPSQPPPCQGEEQSTSALQSMKNAVVTTSGSKKNQTHPAPAHPCQGEGWGGVGSDEANNTNWQTQGETMNKLPTSQRTPSRPPPWQGEEQSTAALQSMETGEVITTGSNKNQTEVVSTPSPDKGRAGVGSVQTKPPNSGLNNPTQTKPIRQKLRKNPTQPEKQFWSWVRAKQLGVKFRRQHGIGKYIVDFYCAELKLIIELDGDSHFTSEGIASDVIRSEFLNSFGLKIIRFTNEQIMKEKEGVLITLVEIIRNKKQ